MKTKRSKSRRVVDQRKATGQRLREARIRASLGVPEVARRLKCVPQTIYRYEWGVVEMSLADLRKLAELYRTSVGWLANAEPPRRTA